MTAATTTIRFTEEDLQLIAALKRRTGIRSTTELVRYSLRTAEKQHPEVLNDKKVP